MFDENTSLCSLQILLDRLIGKGQWLNLEVETIVFELGGGSELLLDKLYVLKAINHNLNSAVALPEFLLWATAVANNKQANFQTVNIPTCLELAWFLVELKKLSNLTGQSFEASAELQDTVAYLLRHEGFSAALPPFEFVPATKLAPGQTEQDTAMKKMAIESYVKHMQDFNYNNSFSSFYSEGVEESSEESDD